MLRNQFVFLLLILLLSNCSEPSSKESIRVAISADMQFAMDSIAHVFEKKHGIHCDLTSNSSGILATQIKHGAPYDVFLSASLKQPLSLNTIGFSEKPVVFAAGQLVFVYSKKLHYQSIEEALQSDNIKRVAQADLIGAPYGIATNEYLVSTQQLAAVKPKLVYGESIEQVNQFLVSNAVDAVFTSYSFLSKHKDDYHFMVVDPQYFAKIEQGISVLKSGRKNHPAAADKLFAFFKTQECKSILKHFGYLVD